METLVGRGGVHSRVSVHHSSYRTVKSDSFYLFFLGMFYIVYAHVCRFLSPVGNGKLQLVSSHIFVLEQNMHVIAQR